MVKCTDCGKEIPEGHDLPCDMCGALLCKECGTTGLCSKCAEVWESEIDLEDVETEECASQNITPFTDLPIANHNQFRVLDKVA